MSQDEPSFGSEYAKSDRSQCKLCKSCIEMGTLRLSIYVQVYLRFFRNKKREN